jgi:hypothetical protein
MIGVTAAVSGGAYFMRGDTVTAVAWPVALGSVVGAVAVLVALAVQMLLQAFGINLLKGSK